MSKLYTPSLLALATQLSEFPLDKEFTHIAQGRSRTCGSTIELGVDLGEKGAVKAIGMQVSACAIGQSSAAIMAKGALGKRPEDILAATHAIEAWLSGASELADPLPDWPEFDALTPALEHKGRHGALLLAWTAITQALSSEVSAR